MTAEATIVPVTAEWSLVEQVMDLAPIFVAPPNGDDFLRPHGWQGLTRQGNQERLDRYRRGSALCAVAGEHLAVVDVDPRNGGDVEKVRALLDGLAVRVFGEVATPGGGWHFYVAGHPDLPSCHDLVGYPGVDVLSHGANVFLPGTFRRKYDGRGYTVVTADLEALADGGDPDGAEAFADWVAQHRATASSGNTDPAPPWDGTPPDERQASYLRAVLDNQRYRVETAQPGTRNPILYDAAMKCGSFVTGAGLDEQEVVRSLSDACVINGLVAEDGERSVLASIRSGLRNGKRNPKAVPEQEEPPPVTVLDADVNEDEFWTAREALAHIREFARARRAAPWAVLGVVLARVVVQTPPLVVLPPMVGTDASLNLFLAIVGASGNGKGAAVGAGRDAVEVGYVNTFPVGSGEGLTHLFVRRTKEGIEQHTQALLAEVAEVDTLAALGARLGATIQPVLRQAYMGEQFGFGYADPSKRLVVGAHQYRLSLIVGVQPKRAGALLDDADGGTPQRLLWLPATDPGAPDIPPDVPDRWRWKQPELPTSRPYYGRFGIPVCETARAAVDTARLARIRGQEDALDGHALLTRLKVAAALGLLDGRYEVGEEDWRLAGTVMAVSDSTRARVVAELAKGQRDRNRARGEAEAERAVIITERQEGQQVRRVSKTIHRKLSTSTWTSHADLRRTLNSRDRKYFDDAIALLLDEGQAEAEEVMPDEHGGGGHGQHYRASKK